MGQLLLWIVLGLLAFAAVGTVLNFGFWLIGTALFLITAFALFDVVVLSGMSPLKKLLWGLGVFFLPPVGALGWLVLKPSADRRLLD